MPAVSFIITTYNGQKLLAKHLPAVFAAAQPGDEVIIIDDASHDTTKQWLNAEYHLQKLKQEKDYSVWGGTYKKQTVKCIFNTSNLRFAASTNRAVQFAAHPILFLLNNDVSPHADVLQYALPHFDDPSVFAVGCLEYEGQEKSGKKKLWFARGMFMHSKGNHDQNGEMDWINGGSGFFDKEKWLQLNGFDVRYAPAYWEDIDLSYRARRRGWRILFEQRAVVDHKHESTNASVFGQRQMMQMSWRNSQKFLWKNGTVWQKLQFILWRPYWWLQWWKTQSS